MEIKFKASRERKLTQLAFECYFCSFSPCSLSEKSEQREREERERKREEKGETTDLFSVWNALMRMTMMMCFSLQSSSFIEIIRPNKSISDGQ